MNSTKKSVTYVSPDIRYCPVAEQLEKYLDIKFNRVTMINELFPLLSDPKFATDLVLIDIEGFYELNGASVFDVIRTLSTLISCTVHRIKSGKPIKRETVLAAIAQTTTDPRLIKEILSVTDIKGVYPRGDAFSLDEKKHAVTELLSGQCHVPQKINELLKSKKKTVKSSTIVLTPRQTQILDLITTRGASNKVIAKILGLSESTVKLHLSAVFKKYGVRSRTQLAVFNKQ